MRSRYLRVSAADDTAVSSSEDSASPSGSPSRDSTDADLTRSFLSGLVTRVENMNRAQREGDVARLGKLAHQLKGTAGGFGLPAIAYVAQRLVKEIQEERDQQSLATTLSELTDLCNEAIVGGGQR